MVVQLRPASSEDIVPLAALAKQTFIDAWTGTIGIERATEYTDTFFTVEKLAEEIAHPANYFVLVTPETPEEDRARLVGYAKLDRARPAPESVRGNAPIVLQRFYLASEARGTGVADFLLLHCLKFAQSEGYQTVWLEAHPSNPRAWRFYVKRGFVEVGTEPYCLPGGLVESVRILTKTV
jgi:ribosomal protein S18 acetylase RimI-like enzyme